MVTVSGHTYRGPPTPPVALSQVLDLNSEEPVFHTSEDKLEHREREGSPHSQCSGDWDPHAMDVDEGSSVGRDQRFTLIEVKTWSFGKLECLTRPSFLRGLIKPCRSQLASRASMEPQLAFDKFPFSRQAEVAVFTQNGVLQGVDESVPEKDISCSSHPLSREISH